MTDLWVIYSFVSIYLNMNIKSEVNEEIFYILFVIYTLKLVVSLVGKLFENSYFEIYDFLETDDLMDIIYGPSIRFKQIDSKRIDSIDDLKRRNIKYKYVYLLKDTYVKGSRFLCILFEEYDVNKWDRFKVKKKYYSDDFDEVKYVFDNYVSEIKQKNNTEHIE